MLFMYTRMILVSSWMTLIPKPLWHSQWGFTEWGLCSWLWCRIWGQFYPMVTRQSNPARIFFFFTFYSFSSHSDQALLLFGLLTFIHLKSPLVFYLPFINRLNIQKTKIMVLGPITSWQTDGETRATVRDFVFLDSKITADGDCSHIIKRCLLLGRKTVTNLDSRLKSRDTTLLSRYI